MASNLLPIWAATGTIVAPDATKVSVGWTLGEKPPYEYMNWWQSQHVDRINHILANGVPQWEATKTYAVDTLALRGGIIYRAISANTNSAPPSANWLAVTQNGAALTSGIIPSARLTGAYTNFTNIAGSGSATMSTFIASSANGFRGVAADGPTGPSFTWVGDQDTGMSHPAADTVVIGTAGIERMRVSPTGDVNVVGALTAGSLGGNGSGLTALNASALSSGTIPNARLTGAYDGVSAFTVTDRITAPSGGVATVPRYGFANEGAGAGMHFLVGSLSLLLRNADGRAALTLADGAATVTGILNGNGSGLTNLNASAMSSGVVPDSRINGAYSNFTSVTGSATATFGSFVAGTGFFAPSGDSAAAPGHSWAGDSDTGVFRAGANVLGITTGGVERARFSSAGMTVGGAVTAGAFAGDGSALTAMSAAQLTSGTLPNGRLSGDYSFANLTLTGNIGASDANVTRLRSSLGTLTDLPWAFFNDSDTGVYRPSANSMALVTGGAERLNIGTNVTALGGAAFYGPGTGLTDVPAASVTGSASLSAVVLPTSTGADNWVKDRIAGGQSGEVGTYSMMTQNSGTTVNRNGTTSGSNLVYYRSSIAPSGTWRLMTAQVRDTSYSDFPTIWLRIS